ncbi:MAG TPA: lysophospholipid acyltransferase family protein [Pyrinomonadaceae bacterium]|jgi:1-acyl-sn-glycerol-3-phosphate acyltransferase
MPEVRVLRLSEMLLRQKGSPARRIIHLIITVALRLFFRRIETSHAELVPMTGPLIFVLNHPNGLIDPALIFCALPRRVSFLAKSTLFRLPVLGWLMREVDALPVYRRIDKGEDVSQNRQTFAACYELLRRERCIAVFPEGISHNSTFLLPVKTGAARIALGALSVKGKRNGPAEKMTLRIVPVGLYYTSKTSFRSEALLRFGSYIEVQAIEADENGEPPREAVKLLSGQIEAALREVTLNVEDTRALEEINRAEQLFSSLYESMNFRQSLSDEFDLRRRFAEERKFYRTQSPERMEELLRRIMKYEEELGSLGITSENLSVYTHSRWYVFQHFLLKGLLLLLFSPLALAGALLHYPAYLLCDILAHHYQKHGADDVVSTVKILAAVVLMPLTWIVVTVLAYIFLGWRVALMVFPLVILCGYLAMHCLEEMDEMKGWYRALRVLLGERKIFIRLIRERRLLHNEIRRLARETGTGRDNSGPASASGFKR